MQLSDDRGSAVAEFVMVGALLTALALAVVQLALALHVRNTLVDAAAEGARYASLADSTPADGVLRTRELVAAALGEGYPVEVGAREVAFHGHPAIEITVSATLPIAGLLGPPSVLEVSGHAALEPTVE